MRSITVRLPEDVEKQLTLVAEGTDRSLSYVTVQALREFLAREAAFVADVKEGLAAAERGEFVSDEEVAATFEKYRRAASAGESA
ncbi:MAG: hypothetical protein AAF354_04070 [Pseudomonadota bacterium]